MMFKAQFSKQDVPGSKNFTVRPYDDVKFVPCIINMIHFLKL
jgi:hypothetical protein